MGPDDFPSRFARYFFGVLTFIILYYSYLIIKPFLVEIFLALVLFIISKPTVHHDAPAYRVAGGASVPPSPVCF